MASQIKPQFKKSVNIDVELVYDDTRLLGIAETLTPDDIYVRTPPGQASFDLEKELKLNIKLSPDETISLLCNATYLHIHNHPTYGLINNISLKISKPTREFKKFLRNSLY